MSTLHKFTDADQCGWHKDASRNEGPSRLLIAGTGTGGGLELETGEVFDKRGVWHEYDGARVAHRVLPLRRERLSQVIWQESQGPNYEICQHEFFEAFGPGWFQDFAKIVAVVFAPEGVKALRDVVRCRCSEPSNVACVLAACRRGTCHGCAMRLELEGEVLRVCRACGEAWQVPQALGECRGLSLSDKLPAPSLPTVEGVEIDELGGADESVFALRGVLQRGSAPRCRGRRGAGLRRRPHASQGHGQYALP